MNVVKKIFSSATGYWLHKISTLPVGADLFIDIHKRIKYGPLNTIFDVGANKGQTLHWFRFNEPAAKIYSFEPVSDTYKELNLNVKNNKNCVLEQIAFGEVPGEKTIKLFNDHTVLNSLKDELMNNNANAREETIQVDTVDNYCLRKGIDKIDLLKIDTEGYELNVLEGATQMLESKKIMLVFCEAGFMKQNTRNTYFPTLSEWLALRDYYFFGLYQMDSHGWKSGNYLGNALFVHTSIFTP